MGLMIARSIVPCTGIDPANKSIDLRLAERAGLWHGARKNGRPDI